MRIGIWILFSRVKFIGKFFGEFGFGDRIIILGMSCWNILSEKLVVEIICIFFWSFKKYWYKLYVNELLWLMIKIILNFFS